MRHGRYLAIGLILAFSAVGFAATVKKKPAQVKEYKRKKVFKRKVDPNRPTINTAVLERQFKKMAQDALEAQIQTLDQLLSVTEDNDPQKPVMLYKLADLYWEKSNGFFLRAYGLDEKIFQAKNSGQTGLASKLASDKTKYNKLSQEWRLKVIETYKKIDEKHPNFKDLDAVYYYIGYHYSQMGMVDNGYKYFQKLVNQRPKSRLVPEALLSIGDYHFNNRRLDEAEIFYKRAELFTGSKAYGFALYKHAWVYYNRRQYVQALKKFLQVIKYADSKKILRKKDRLNLRREAIRDLVKTYSQVGNAERALPFFKKIAPTFYLELGQMLAYNYHDNGQYENAVQLNRLLIANAPHDKRVLIWQREVVNNTDRIPNSEEKTVKEVGRLVALLLKMKDKVPATFLAKQEKEIDELMRVLATQYHKIAESSKRETFLAYAHHMYREYFRVFKASPELTAMTMNYANLLYNLNQWKMAASMYERVLESDTSSKYSDDAAFFVLMCYNHLISVSNELSKDKGDLTKKRPISDLFMRMVRACDRYVDVAKKTKKEVNNEDVVKAKFAAAKIYADHGHIDEAIKRFKTLREEHKNHYLAGYATKYLVVLLQIQGKIKDIEDIARTSTNLDPEVKNTLNKIRKKNQFNACFDLEEKKRWVSAADCFRAYTRKFTDANDLDQALYKAAQNYQKAKAIEQAIEALGELYNKRSSSKLAPDALYSIGQLYQSVAVYSEAAKYFEIFVQNHAATKKKLAEKAVIAAALFRQGLQQYDKAIENYKRFLQLFTTSSQVMRVYYNIGLIFERQKKWSQMQDHFERYLRLYADRGSTDMKISAMYKIGWALWKQRKTKKALKQFKQVTLAWKRLGDASRTKLTFGRTQAAHARFMEGEFLLDEAEKIKLKLPQSRLKKLFKKKGQAIADAARVFMEVRTYRDPNWTIAAICRVGKAYQQFGDAIEKAPVPAKIRKNEIQLDAYKTFLDNVAENVKKKSVAAYKGCLKLAEKLSWFNKFSTEAEQNLTKLDYSIKVMKELRPAPKFLLTKNRLSDFDTTLPD
ncbi:MAG: tetratricopeptide repeat protein [Myxococcales bacterium]|nr:tetratricopeptide repeat protein [Myxococcales bacterium]